MFRPIEHADLEILYQINIQNSYTPWAKQALLDEIKQARPYSFVLYKENLVIGYAFVRKTGDYHEITSIAVEKSHQNKGWGSLILNKVISDCKNLKNIKGLLLEVSVLNEPAMRFYLKLGFTKTRIRKRYYPDGSDAQEMSLQFT